MAELKTIACGICKDPFLNDSSESEALLCCGHIYHSVCLKKFEQEADVVLRVCFCCKADYAKVGTLKLKPMFAHVQLEPLRGLTDDCGVGEHKSDIKALKTEVKNLKAQIKKDAKIAAEQQRTAELKEQVAKNKFRRLVTGVQDMHTSMMKFVDPSDFEVIEEETIAVAERVEPEVRNHVSTRSRDKDGTAAAAVNGWPLVKNDVARETRDTREEAMVDEKKRAAQKVVVKSSSSKSKKK